MEFGILFKGVQEGMPIFLAVKVMFTVAHKELTKTLSYSVGNCSHYTRLIAARIKKKIILFGLF